jgi:hypothetical protein
MPVDFEKVAQNTGALNAAFAQALDDPSSKTELAEKVEGYIHTQLREESFFDKIMRPEPCTKDDVIPEVDEDTVYKLVPIEPGSYALAVDFRSEGATEFVKGKRFKVRFFKIQTPDFIKDEAELYAHQEPAIKIIEENIVKDMGEVADLKFLEYCQKAIVKSGKKILGSTYSTAKTVMDTEILKDGYKLFGDHEPACDLILMNNQTFQDIYGLDATTLGDSVASTVIVDGYKYPQLHGKKLVVSNKATTINAPVGKQAYILPYGQIWLFTEKKYFGSAFTLGNARLYMDKKGPIITWFGWRYLAMGIGNYKSVAKLEFGSGEGKVPGALVS